MSKDAVTEKPGRATAPGARRMLVAETSVGQRLDNFLLRECKGVPRSLIYRLLRKGAIRVNGCRAKPDARLQSGDQLHIPALDQAPPAQAATIPAGILHQLRQAIIFEDRDYLVLDKPAGLAVHGGSGLGFGVIEAMRRLRPQATLELGHRLDRDTSGCLVLTKQRPALLALHQALREHQVKKRYLALVLHPWAASGETVACHIPIAQERDRRGHKQMATATDQKPDQGKPRAATSWFEPLVRYRQHTLVAVRIDSGRTHQIRVHSQALGHPVLGDHEYGDAQANRQARQLGLERLFLHAQAIEFPDARGEERIFSAPLPDDLQQVLDRMHTA